MAKKILMLVMILGIGLSARAQEKKINKTFEGVKKIELNTASGDAIFSKGANDKVELELSYTFDEDEYTPSMNQDGSVLVLKEKFNGHGSHSGQSTWNLKVPENIEISFNTGSGNLDVRSLPLKISSNSGSGDVKLMEVNGNIKVNTGSGDIDVASFEGDLKINAGSGNVDLSDSKGDFSVNLGSGDIDASKLTGEFSMNVGSGDINGTSLTLTASSSFNSGSGDAKITLNAELKNDISINSGSGNAVLDFNGLEIKGEFTMKANKKHGEISAPFKFDSETEENSGDQTILKKTAKIGNSDIQINIATGSGRAVVEK